MLDQWHGLTTVWCNKIRYNILCIKPYTPEYLELIIDDVTLGKYLLYNYVLY